MVTAALFGLVGSSVAFASAANAATLPTPSNVRALWATTSSAKVTWDVSGTAPIIRVAWSKTEDFASFTAKPTTSTVYTLTGLSANTTYFVMVRAESADKSEHSDWSDVASFKTDQAPQLVRIGSFNIKDPDTTGGSCGPWDGRKAGVAADIVASKADVVGIQEAYEQKDRDSLMAAIQAAGGTYAMTLPTSDGGGWDNRLLYNPSRVTLIETHHEAFAKQDGEGRDREVVWATFELKSNHNRFMVFTTHLEPGATAAVTKAQWDSIRWRAQNYSVVDGARLPVFVVGDFNTSKFHPPADYMLPAMKKAGFGDVLGQTYRSYTVSGQRAKTKTDAWINSFNDCRRSIGDYSVSKSRIANNVDWIFASNDLAIPAWKTTVHLSGSTLKTPIPSDHFMISIQALIP